MRGFKIPDRPIVATLTLVWRGCWGWICWGRIWHTIASCAHRTNLPRMRQFGRLTGGAGYGVPQASIAR